MGVRFETTIRMRQVRVTRISSVLWARGIGYNLKVQTRRPRGVCVTTPILSCPVDIAWSTHSVATSVLSSGIWARPSPAR